jgi:hypothetical protein
VKFLSVFALPFASTHTPLDPAAIVAPHRVETPAVVTEASQGGFSLQPDDTLGEACAKFRRACAEGASDREAMAVVFETLARADLSSLTLNGPHVRACDRVSRKGVRKAQRVLLAIAEQDAGGAL